MSDSTTTISDSAYSQNSQPSSYAAPIIGGGLVLLLLGVLIRQQMLRQRPSVAVEAEKPTSDQVSFSQPLQWVSHGKELERQQQYEAAISVYDQGLSEYPNNFRLWHERGLAFAKLQQFELALDSFNHAHRIRPNDVNLCHERGDTLLQLGRYEEAIASFDIYLRYDSNSAHVLADRGYALCQLGRFEEALQCLTPVLKNHRHDRNALGQAHYYQIEALRHLGQLEAALHSSQLAMKQYADEYFEAQRETIREQIIKALTDEDATP